MEGLEVTFDAKPKATIGFVEIPTDVVVEMDAGALLSQVPGILWRFTKMNFDGEDEEINEETYEWAKKNIEKAAKTFLPTEKGTYGSLDVIAMSCTSLSFTLGNKSKN